MNTKKKIEQTDPLEQAGQINRGTTILYQPREDERDDLLDGPSLWERIKSWLGLNR